jgi:hypothetical protein
MAGLKQALDTPPSQAETLVSGDAGADYRLVRELDGVAERAAGTPGTRPGCGGPSGRCGRCARRWATRCREGKGEAMGVDYCACGVYGCEPEGPVWDRIVQLLDREREAFEALPDDEQEALTDQLEEKYDGVEPGLMYRVLEKNPDVLVELREQYGLAPTSRADLHWTGNPDDRPGRCDTAGEGWLFGWGLYGFPLDELVPESFKEKYGDWHTWVTVF